MIQYRYIIKSYCYELDPTWPESTKMEGVGGSVPLFLLTKHKKRKVSDFVKHELKGVLKFKGGKFWPTQT
jgi:hypothetical protein